MRLSCKHQGQQTITMNDFTGGLNTSNAVEMIAPNELAQAVNVEIDNSTGLLCTVSGTRQIYIDKTKHFKRLAHDSINNLLLVFDGDGVAYKINIDGTGITKLDKLSGANNIVTATWENGILVASGGQLQYYDGKTFSIITESPKTCNGVYVREGRVLVYSGDTITFSGVGDEHNWTQNNNDAASSKFIQIGYKDGGSIIGVCNLSSDLLIIKDNNKVYRLVGSYPNWAVVEVGRNIDCRSSSAYCPLINSAIILGRTSLQCVTTTQTYGDMRVDNLGIKVINDLASIPSNAALKFLPSKNQIWILDGTEQYLIYDTVCHGFFRRRYNGVIKDAISIGDKIYMLKEHGLYTIDGQDGSLTDDGRPLAWSFKTHAMVSRNNFLIKRAYVDITPYFKHYATSLFTIGKMMLEGALPPYANCIYHDFGYIYRAQRYLVQVPKRPLYSTGDWIYNNPAYIMGDPQKICNVSYYRTDKRCVQRVRTIDVNATGSAGALSINSIGLDIVEV